MNIDLSKKENLILKSERRDFVKAIEYLFSKKSVVLSQASTDLSSLTSIKDHDLDLLLYFMLKLKFSTLEDNKIIMRKMISSQNLFLEFSNFYFKLLQSNNEVNFHLFQNSKFNVINDIIILDVDSVEISYRPYLISLQKLGFLSKSDKKRHVQIKEFKLAKKLLDRPLKKISQKEFDKQLEAKKLRGELSENFVLEIEKKKLEGSDKEPIQVSIENVTLGYDILSYDKNGNEIYIEVKTLMNGDSFFWTNNEINTAKKLKESYLIYCVQFNRSEPEKIKKIIENPYRNIFIEKKYENKSTGDYIIKI